MEFLANNPILLVFTYCLCAPGGILPAVGIYYVARHYNISNPFSPRREERGGGMDDI